MYEVITKEIKNTLYFNIHQSPLISVHYYTILSNVTKVTFINNSNAEKKTNYVGMILTLMQKS